MFCRSEKCGRLVYVRLREESKVFSETCDIFWTAKSTSNVQMSTAHILSGLGISPSITHPLIHFSKHILKQLMSLLGLPPKSSRLQHMSVLPSMSVLDLKKKSARCRHAREKLQQVIQYLCLSLQTHGKKTTEQHIISKRGSRTSMSSDGIGEYIFRECLRVS